MFDGIFNDEVRFFSDNYEFSGINLLEIAYRSSSEAKTILGNNVGITVPTGPTQQQMTLNRELIYRDPVIDYTGANPIAGSIFYNDEYYGFNEAYLLNYSLSCAVGAVPKSSSSFIIADEMMSGISGAKKRIVKKHPIIDPPSQGSISITCDNFETNRVTSFNYSLNVNRKLLYSVGEILPCSVELIKPISFTANATIDVDNAFLENSHNFLKERENKNVSINIKGRDGNEIQSVNIPNASIVNEILRISSEGDLKLDINYVGHG